MPVMQTTAAIPDHLLNEMRSLTDELESSVSTNATVIPFFFILNTKTKIVKPNKRTLTTNNSGAHKSNNQKSRRRRGSGSGGIRGRGLQKKRNVKRRYVRGNKSNNNLDKQVVFLSGWRRLTKNRRLYFQQVMENATETRIPGITINNSSNSSSDTSSSSGTSSSSSSSSVPSSSPPNQQKVNRKRKLSKSSTNAELPENPREIEIEPHQRNFFNNHLEIFYSNDNQWNPICNGNDYFHSCPCDKSWPDHQSWLNHCLLENNQQDFCQNLYLAWQNYFSTHTISDCSACGLLLYSWKQAQEHVMQCKQFHHQLRIACPYCPPYFL